jgi:hypothetical protein
MSLNEREQYCLALIITKGGETKYEEIRDTILEFKESFRDLSERYLKYQAVKGTLSELVNKEYLSEQKSEIFKVNPFMVAGFIQQFPILISKSIENNLKFRKEHILEFDTSGIEGMLLDDEWMDEVSENPPYDLIEHLRDALKLQRVGPYDSVLVKCGKCVEIMVSELDYDYSLFNRKLSTGRIITRLRDEDILKKVTKKVNRESFKTFVDGINVVYRFRNIMGAHSGFEWGIDQVATSCLILTFYLADLYIWNIRKSRS